MPRKKTTPLPTDTTKKRTHEAQPSPEALLSLYFRALNDATPEVRREMVLAAPDEIKPLIRQAALVSLAAGADSPESFAAFYELVHGNELPKHARGWIKRIYKAHDEGIGALLWSWRGSWKSTTVSATFTAYRIGKEPNKTNIIVGANDDSADKVTAAIAQIIELNQAWKQIFPNVIPDKVRGWGAEGYWVTDTRYNKEEWARVTSATIDPTLVGGGWKSSRIVGKHPTGLLILDDVHDERNSSSERECAAVVVYVSDTLLPTAVREDGTGKLTTWLVAIGTPWSENDAYHFLKNTGQFEFIHTPVMVEAEEGDGGAVYIDGRNRDGLVFTDIVGWWIPTWPEKFGTEAIIANRAIGARGFARMFLLDLKRAKTRGLKYYLYPHEKIDPRWEMGGGCDLATVLQKGIRDDPGRDYFSHGYGAKDPLNRLIVVDGIIEQCTQAQAEDHLAKAQSLFRDHWRHTVLEGDGAGETFYVSLVRRQPGLRVIMQKTKGKSKRYRQEQEMGPWLERAIVMISDADTPYLNALRKALDDFPDGNNDIRDGLYWLCYAFPEILQMPKVQEELPSIKRREKPPNPLLAFGRR